MIRKVATGLALASLMGAAAFAETYEVQMLNKGVNRPGFSGGSKSRKDWSHGKRQQSEPLFT